MDVEERVPKAQVIRKDISTLAFSPVNANLTVTARKVWLQLLWIAQNSPRTADGGYRAVLTEVVRHTGTNVMSKVMRGYLENMVTTSVVFRPVSLTEQYSLLEDSRDEAMHKALAEEEDEERIFTLLAEVRITKQGGDTWLEWFYPPTLEQQIIEPNRWAAVDLRVVAMLTTYTSVALYEIVVRYRDSPGKLTPRRPVEWWTQVLKSKVTTKDREWRKFKAEFVTPAILEINEVSDLHVELVEHRYGGRRVVDIQFRITRKLQVVREVGKAVDIQMIEIAARNGIRESDLAAFQKEFDEVLLRRGFAALETRKARATVPIGNPVKYMRVVLESLHQQPILDLEPTEYQQAEAKAKVTATPGPRLENLAQRRHDLIVKFDERRRLRLAGQFESLTEQERSVWMDRFAQSLGDAVHEARVRRRLEVDRNWKSPIVNARLMKFYAQQGLGEEWAEPNSEDLAIIAADLL